MDFWFGNECRAGNRLFAAAAEKGGRVWRSKGLSGSMLSREHRVPRRRFPSLLRASRLWTAPSLSLRVARRQVKATLFAFVVSHKVAARAVDRNRLKRRARAIVRDLLSKVKDNYACLLFFKKPAAKLSYQELKNVIQEIITRSNVILF